MFQNDFERKVWLDVLLEMIEELGRDAQAGRVQLPSVIEISRLGFRPR
jgi:hypothetical protein